MEIKKMTNEEFAKYLSGISGIKETVLDNFKYKDDLLKISEKELNKYQEIYNIAYNIVFRHCKRLNIYTDREAGDVKTICYFSAGTGKWRYKNIDSNDRASSRRINSADK